MMWWFCLGLAYAQLRELELLDADGVELSVWQVLYFLLVGPPLLALALGRFLFAKGVRSLG